MSIYATAVKRPVTTALLFVAVVILGLFSLSRLSIDLLPEIETNQLMVITSYQGASASDVETNVTKPLENVLNTVSDLKHVISQSKENTSIVTLEFNYGTDINQATNDVRDKLDLIENRLPDGVDNPIIFKFGTDDIPILVLSVTADKSFPALYKMLDDKVSNPLQRIAGVGAVSIMGVPQREVYIYCDPTKLESFNLSVEAVAAVVGAENRNTPLGSMDMGSNTYALRVQGELSDVRQLEDLIVSNVGQKTVYLRDVARVTDGLQERAQEVYIDGAKGGLLIVQKQSGANSVDIAKKVQEQLPLIEAQLPPDVKIGVIADTSENIVNTINSLTRTVLETLLIVMVVVLFFLGRWRATLIIVITIPISLIAAFAYLMISGNTINIISLSSLSIAIGMVVDDAIVVLENITTHIERGSKPMQAAVHATNEVAVSVVASTLTLIAVFLPLTMVTGLAGMLFEQLGWVVTIIMTLSLVASLMLTPMMSARLLARDKGRSRWFSVVYSPIERFLAALERGYTLLLNWSVRHRAVVLLLAVALFVSSLGLVSRVGSDFFPSQDNGRISVEIEMPIGTRMEVARDLAMRIDTTWRRLFPEIVTGSISVGQASADNTFGTIQSNGSHIISMNIKLDKLKNRTRSMGEIGDLLREDLRRYPEIFTAKVITGGSSGMGGQTALEVDVFGQDFGATDSVSRLLAQQFRLIPGASEVSISRDEYVPEFQIDFDRDKLSLHGLNLSAAANAVRGRVNGVTASLFREDGDEYNIRVMNAPQFRTSIEDLENILIYNAMGNGVRVRDVATVGERLTPPTIERKNRERVVTVSAVVAKGYSLSDVVEAAKVELSQIELPEGVAVALGGDYEDQQDSFSDLYLLMLLIGILVYIVMASQFESLTSPFIIMLSLPFAFTGVFLGLVATGTPISIMSLVGMIMLIGIVVKNGIVLVDYINLNRERGLAVIPAVLNAGKSRLRPVLMTSLTTILGMLPMAMGTGEGAEMWRPMGITVASGLAVSTLLTLILVPVVYSVFAGFGMRSRRRQRAEKL